MSNHSNAVHILKFESLDSTNNYAMNLLKEGKASNLDCIWALQQTKGRGQRGNTWESDAGKNLTFSLICFPAALEAAQGFYLSMAVSLAALEFIRMYSQAVMIKWPNDIYLKGRKTGGILIENTIEGPYIKASVLGMGLNINQKHFSGDLPHATSLASVCGKELDLEQALGEISGYLVKQLRRIDQGEYESLRHDYKANLLGMGENMEYRDKKGIFFGMITGVEESGRLVIMDTEGTIRKYYFQEVEWIR